MIVGKIIKAFFRFFTAMLLLLAGMIMVTYIMIWDFVCYRILRKPKKEQLSIDFILENEKHSKSDTTKITKTEPATVTKN